MMCGILAISLIFVQSCTQLPNGSYTKDLTVVESDLARVCLVDNSPISYNINQCAYDPVNPPFACI
jgi:CTD nuclear envelope phosphatase 1